MWIEAYLMILYKKGFGAFNLLGRVYGSSWPRAFVLAVPSTVFGALLRSFGTQHTASHLFLHPYTCKRPEMLWRPHKICECALHINIAPPKKEPWRYKRSGRHIPKYHRIHELCTVFKNFSGNFLHGHLDPKHHFLKSSIHCIFFFASNHRCNLAF